MLIDYHTHIGPFYQIYYDYHNVFSALKMNGVEKTVCAYLTPRFSEKRDAVDYYYAVIEELSEACKYAQKIALQVNFLHWADPLLFDAGFSLSQIYNDFYEKTKHLYYGIALHPGLHNWTSLKERETLLKVFEFAKTRNTPLFIHTGVSEYDNPCQFVKYFELFPEVEVHLAHCKDADTVISIFSSFQNIYGDTAFCPEDSYRKICDEGYAGRMYFGSDFPITHYWKVQNSLNKEVSLAVLNENYREIKKFGIS